MGENSCWYVDLLREVSSLENVLLVNIGGTKRNHEFVHNLVSKYHRIRDYHNNPPHFATLFYLANFLAHSINLSEVVITEVGSWSCNKMFLKNILILDYYVYASKLRAKHNEHKNTHGDNLRLLTIQRFNKPFACAICDQPQKELNIGPRLYL